MSVKMTQRLEIRKISELIPYANNARTHSPSQIEQLRRSLREFGFVTPVLIDGAGNVIAGHGRIEAAKLEGIEEAPCVLVEHLTDAQRRAYILADNRLAELSDWDEVTRSAELLRLRDEGVDITLTGFGVADVMLTSVDEVIEDDCDLTVPADPVVQIGQLWQLGRHRLLCGDATSPPHVHLCVGEGQLVDLLQTDPPYGVDYSSAAGSILNDEKKGEALYNFLLPAFTAAADVLAPGAAWYCWAPTGPNLEWFLRAARASGLPVHQLLVWCKPQFVLGRADYHHQHEVCLHGCSDSDPLGIYEGYEPCAYGWKDGAPHLWCSDRKQSTILEYAKPLKSEMHPTMKPVQMIAYQICNNTLPGAVALDPFGGSGTTLIACEQTGRSCRMMEIDPKYCDVIIRRWEALTGEKAVLLNG